MSSIEQLIRKTRNETLDDIQMLEKSILRCKETIRRLQSDKQTYNPKVVIERYTTDLERFQKEFESLEKRLIDIDEGRYETQLREELEQNKQMIQQKSTATKKKKTENTLIQQTKKFVPPKRGSKDYVRSDRDIEREMDQHERYFLKDCANIPNYLLEKLDNMPNNMGYIWKDIWCFGKLSPNHNKNEITLFEKKNQQFLVHTYNQQYYCLYEKDNTGRKKLLSKRQIQYLPFRQHFVSRT